MFTLSVVVPLNNESALVSQTVSDLQDMLTSLSLDYEIVLVENGSTDNTYAVISALAVTDTRIKILSLPTGDYGAALRHGVLNAKYSDIVIFDADLYSKDFLKSTVDIVTRDRETSIIVASKMHESSVDTRSIYRRAGTALFNKLIKRLCGLKVSDTHGMKYINKSILSTELVKTKEIGSLFDTALVVRAERNGKKVKEVPCTVNETRPARTSYLKRVPRTLYQAVQLRKSLKNTR
jgi:glycosyltransferase involved in cell wall biosynthesis